MSDRIAPRLIKRLEVTFSSGGIKYKGISSNLSETGLFIRTQHGFVPGTPLDIELYLPGGGVSRLKGTVRRTEKSSLSVMTKNGMGVQLTGKDSEYEEFIRSVGLATEALPEETETVSGAAQDSERRDDAPKTPVSIILACPSCSVKNRVRQEKLLLGPRCGKCGATLDVSAAL